MAVSIENFSFSQDPRNIKLTPLICETPRDRKRISIGARNAAASAVLARETLLPVSALKIDTSVEEAGGLADLDPTNEKEDSSPTSPSIDTTLVTSPTLETPQPAPTLILHLRDTCTDRFIAMIIPKDWSLLRLKQESLVWFQRSPNNKTPTINTNWNPYFLSPIWLEEIKTRTSIRKLPFHEPEPEWVVQNRELFKDTKRVNAMGRALSFTFGSTLQGVEDTSNSSLPRRPSFMRRRSREEDREGGSKTKESRRISLFGIPIFKTTNISTVDTSLTQLGEIPETIVCHPMDTNSSISVESEVKSKNLPYGQNGKEEGKGPLKHEKRVSVLGIPVYSSLQKPKISASRSPSPSNQTRTRPSIDGTATLVSWEHDFDRDSLSNSLSNLSSPLLKNSSPFPLLRSHQNLRFSSNPDTSKEESMKFLRRSYSVNSHHARQESIDLRQREREMKRIEREERARTVLVEQMMANFELRRMGFEGREDEKLDEDRTVGECLIDEELIYLSPAYAPSPRYPLHLAHIPYLYLHIFAYRSSTHLIKCSTANLLHNGLVGGQWNEAVLQLRLERPHSIENKFTFGWKIIKSLEEPQTLLSLTSPVLPSFSQVKTPESMIAQASSSHVLGISWHPNPSTQITQRKIYFGTTSSLYSISDSESEIDQASVVGLGPDEGRARMDDFLLDPKERGIASSMGQNTRGVGGWKKPRVVIKPLEAVQESEEGRTSMDTVNGRLQNAPNSTKSPIIFDDGDESGPPCAREDSAKSTDDQVKGNGELTWDRIWIRFRNEMDQKAFLRVVDLGRKDIESEFSSRRKVFDKQYTRTRHLKRQESELDLQY